MKFTLQTIFITLALALMAACNIGRGFRPPDSFNKVWASRENHSQAEIDKTLTNCGVVYLSNGAGLDRGETANVIIEECIFAKGLYLKSGYGGTCSTPEFRARIPACANAPLRPRNSYYGN